LLIDKHEYNFVLLEVTLYMMGQLSQMCSEPTDFEKQKIVVDRLFVKIDYLKNTRLRIPIFVVIANFALVTLSTRAVNSKSSSLLFAVSFLFVGLVGAYAMWTVWKSFKKNVATLAEYYEKMGIPRHLAEPASNIWLLLMVLVGISSFIPVLLVYTVELSPIYVSRP